MQTQSTQEVLLQFLAQGLANFIKGGMNLTEPSADRKERLPRSIWWTVRGGADQGHTVLRVKLQDHQPDRRVQREAQGLTQEVQEDRAELQSLQQERFESSGAS